MEYSIVYNKNECKELAEANIKKLKENITKNLWPVRFTDALTDLNTTWTKRKNKNNIQNGAHKTGTQEVLKTGK